MSLPADYNFKLLFQYFLFFKKDFLFLFLCECLLACMSMYHVYGWSLWRSEDDFRSPGTGVTGSYEWPCLCWEPNLGPL